MQTNVMTNPTKKTTISKKFNCLCVCVCIWARAGSLFFLEFHLAFFLYYHFYSVFLDEKWWANIIQALRIFFFFLVSSLWLSVAWLRNLFGCFVFMHHGWRWCYVDLNVNSRARFVLQLARPRKKQLFAVSLFVNDHWNIEFAVSTKLNQNSLTQIHIYGGWVRCIS